MATDDLKITLSVILDVQKKLDVACLKLAEDIEQLQKYNTKDYYENKERDRKIREIGKELRQLKKTILYELPKVKESGNGDIEIVLPSKQSLLAQSAKEVLRIPNIIPTILFALVAICAIALSLEIALKDNGGILLKLLKK